MYINEEPCKAFTVVHIQLLFFECFTFLQLDFLVWNLVNLAQLNKPLSKAATVYDQNLIRLIKDIHNGCFHRCRTRTSDKHHSGIIASLRKLFHQLFIFKHDSRELRRSKIWNLFCTNSTHYVIRHYRANCKIKHFIYPPTFDFDELSSITILSADYPKYTFATKALRMAYLPISG